MNLNLFILLCIFILSRVLFINSLPVFFDSPEYLRRFSDPNFFQAIVSGHLPFHITYIMLFWPIFHIALFFKINPSLAVVFAQIIFSAIAIYCFYRFIKIITNKRVALIASVIGASFPLYWITNVSIMQESTCINFFLISAFFLALYAKKKTNLILLLAGCISFGLSLLAHPLAIFWLPFLLSVVYFLKKEKIFGVFSTITITFCLTILINGFFVARAQQISLLTGVHRYLSGGEFNVLPDISSLLTLLRFVRDAFVPILQNNTPFIFILAIISLIKLLQVNRKLFIVAVLWISPILIVNQWFNPLLSGRHGIIAEFGLAFLVGILLEKRRTLLIITIAYIFITYLPALALLKQPIPYLTEQSFVKTLPKGLLIESHFARPQIEGYYSGEIIFVNQPGWDKEKLKKTINNYLTAKKPVFVTSQALSDPYGLYSGPFLLPLSLSYTKTFELNEVILLYSTKKYATIDVDAGLTIYEIISQNKSQYPDIPILKSNRHRINYFDPLNQLWMTILRELKLPKATT